MRKSCTISKLSLYQCVSCPMWVPGLHLRSCIAHALQGQSLTHRGMSATLNYCKCPANRNRHCRKRRWCSLVLPSWECCACTRCVAGSKRSNCFSAVFLQNCASVRVGLPQAGIWPADTIKVVPIGDEHSALLEVRPCLPCLDVASLLCDLWVISHCVRFACVQMVICSAEEMPSTAVRELGWSSLGKKGAAGWEVSW